MKKLVSTLACVAALLPPVFAGSPARAQSMLAGLPIDGIRCDVSEGAVEHVHTHLQLFDRGRAVRIPGQIGIPSSGGCLYWIHTHADDGIIHIESPVTGTFTLGQFFDIWDKTLSRTQADGVRTGRARALRVTVNGKRWRSDPRSIPLRDHEEIVIQSGPPFVAGRHADWSRL